MSEAPDFEKIAAAIIEEHGSYYADDVQDRAGTTKVAEQLRQIWNARGAADAQLFEGEIVALDGYEIPLLIRALDR